MKFKKYDEKIKMGMAAWLIAVFLSSTVSAEAEKMSEEF